ncbi:hypothetical protein V6Z12_A06G196600 [Gossypium hirsutum]
MGRNLTHKFPFWASFQSPCADWFFSPTTRPKHRHTWRPTALKNGLFTLIQGRVLVCMAWREAVRGCAGVEHVGYARMEATVVENVGAWWC